MAVGVVVTSIDGVSFISFIVLFIVIYRVLRILLCYNPPCDDCDDRTDDKKQHGGQGIVSFDDDPYPLPHPRGSLVYTIIVISDARSVYTIQSSDHIAFTNNYYDNITLN